MRHAAAVLGLLLVACAPAAGGRREAAGQSAALNAFQRGDFDKAEALVRGATDDESLTLAGRIHLLKNRGKEAAEALFALVSPYPPFGTKKAKYGEMEAVLNLYPELATAYVRADDFTRAATIYSAMGERALARKYEALGKSVGYLSNLGDGEASIELAGVDPTPHVAMTVNGWPGIFLIDTALDEVVLDRDFAKRAGLQGLGLRTDAYRVSYDESTVEEVGLGRLKVRNVPVHLGQLAGTSKLRADGAVGLSFLMHFDFTLDYRKRRLVLRRPGSAGGAGGLPAVLAGDRYLLVQGSVNGQPGAWIAIGTAMADLVAAASEGTMAGLGGVKELAAGALRLTQPPLDTGAFPLGLDGGFGFPVGFLLGQNALRDHVLRLDPRSMRVWID